MEGREGDGRVSAELEVGERKRWRVRGEGERERWRNGQVEELRG